VNPSEFSRRVEAARRLVHGDAPSWASGFYRRAVATEARRAVPPPTLPHPGLHVAADGIAVLVAAEAPGGRFSRGGVEDALAAARAAGASWAVAWTDDATEVTVLRDLSFLPLPRTDGPGDSSPGAG
jgi:hypothetical protein